LILVLNDKEKDLTKEEWKNIQFSFPKLKNLRLLGKFPPFELIVVFLRKFPREILKMLLILSFFFLQGLLQAVR
jgi:hypothetical protein